MHNKINRARGTHHVRTPATRRSARSRTFVPSPAREARLTRRGIRRDATRPYTPRDYVNVAAPRLSES